MGHVLCRIKEERLARFVGPKFLVLCEVWNALPPEVTLYGKKRENGALCLEREIEGEPTYIYIPPDTAETLEKRPLLRVFTHPFHRGIFVFWAEAMPEGTSPEDLAVEVMIFNNQQMTTAKKKPK